MPTGLFATLRQVFGLVEALVGEDAQRMGAATQAARELAIRDESGTGLLVAEAARGIHGRGRRALQLFERVGAVDQVLQQAVVGAEAEMQFARAQHQLLCAARLGHAAFERVQPVRAAQRVGEARLCPVQFVVAGRGHLQHAADDVVAAAIIVAERDGREGAVAQRSDQGRRGALRAPQPRGPAHTSQAITR